MFNTLQTNFHSNALSSVSDLVKQMGVGGVWGAVGKLKQRFKLKWQCFAISK